MPPKKSQQAQSLARARAVEVLAEKNATLSSEMAAENLWHQLQTANSRITELEEMLALKEVECNELRSNLDKCKQEIIEYKASASGWESKQKATYHDLRMQRQITKRGQTKQAKLQQKIEILQKAEAEASSFYLEGSKLANQNITLLQNSNTKLHHQLSKTMDRCAIQLKKAQSKLAISHSILKTLRKEASALRKAAIYSKNTKDHALAVLQKKISHQRSRHHLMNKGVYTESTRNLVRLLVKAGCSRNYVNEVISAVLQSAGISTIGSISRPSITRIIREGYYAAQIQLGFEMENTQGMTFSADGTSHRSINYNSRHVHLLAEDYSNPDNNIQERATRSFGIKSSRDGSSEEAIADWEATLKNITNIYNDSPLAKRTGSILTFIKLIIKLTGMNTDHCAKEKKDARMLKELKAWAVDQHLGEEKMLNMTFEEVTKYFQQAEDVMVQKAGGKHKWDGLSEIKKAERKAAMTEMAVTELGKEAFEKLSEEDKRILRLFIWAGCGCHKDLNTVRGGYFALLKWYNENPEVERPVLLANRDNDPVVQERSATLEQGDTPTPAQERAFLKSTQGAIKTAEIAGAIFNHKDDKKGHHDVFRYWWVQHVGIPFTFPDTSNNRFQSFCDAAAALILYKDKFVDFLKSLRINKQNSKLNHMEQNLWNALHCHATLTELAILALYAEAISYPYMKAIRNSSIKDQNMLDLGPFHFRVLNHIQNIIINPNILIGENSLHTTASLDGNEWQNPAVVKKILDLIPSLPNFHQLLNAFLIGAADTWKRFTSEFAPGGLIDEATIEEKNLAWMPATNDENEGALGSFRVLMRRQPQLTLLSHNALSMFFRNNTRAFMAAKFTEEEDYQYIHRLAREANGEERKRQKELTEFRDKRQADKIARQMIRIQNARAKKERLAQMELVLDKDKLPGLKGTKLHDQYQLFKEAGAPNLQAGSKPSKVADIRQALSNAIDMHMNGTWKIEDDSESIVEDMQVSENDENEDDWEDE